MRLYIDSVEEKDWMKYLPTGLFYGVTTNPKLLAQSGFDFTINRMSELAQKAFDLGAKEIHIQVWGRKVEEMLKVGKRLAEIDPQVMVKVPINREGILTAKDLIADGSGVTLTAVHAAQQALIAASLGANYAAPYLGRMNDGGVNGLEEIRLMNQILKEVNCPTRLLVASIRQIPDLVKLAGWGLNTFTLLPSLVVELLENQLTNLAVESFQSAIENQGSSE